METAPDFDPLARLTTARAAARATDEALVAAFEHRVQTRDVPPPPEPLRFDPASVQARIENALRQRLVHQNDSRRFAKLTAALYRFLAEPTQLSTEPALRAQFNCTLSALAKAWAELRAAGLVEHYADGRRRRHRLTRAGEDWLLAVVKGEPVPGVR